MDKVSRPRDNCQPIPTLPSLKYKNVILIGTMERPHTKIKYKPPKYCSQCKREVYHTTHSASSYWVDWYGTELKPICVDCYKR